MINVEKNGAWVPWEYSTKGMLHNLEILRICFWSFNRGQWEEKKKKRAITEANPMLSFEPEKWRIKKWFDIDGTE